MKLRVDGSLCTGHGRCYSEAPRIYSPDSDGFSDRRDINREVPQQLQEDARIGQSVCPEGAIFVEEE